MNPRRGFRRPGMNPRRGFRRPGMYPRRGFRRPGMYPSHHARSVTELKPYPPDREYNEGMKYTSEGQHSTAQAICYVPYAMYHMPCTIRHMRLLYGAIYENVPPLWSPLKAETPQWYLGDSKVAACHGSRMSECLGIFDCMYADGTTGCTPTAPTAPAASVRNLSRGSCEKSWLVPGPHTWHSSIKGPGMKRTWARCMQGKACWLGTQILCHIMIPHAFHHALLRPLSCVPPLS